MTYCAFLLLNTSIFGVQLVIARQTAGKTGLACPTMKLLTPSRLVSFVAYN